ncbi:uncharacterized protein [Diadema setosum]|uniref:uncharacterized protein n=1 Tax=Diadema setosum TaxID=31175 RepID=UPI003B3B807B
MATCAATVAMDPKNVAKEIKELHEQSGEIFPNDRASGFDRFGSLYARDFSLDAIRPKVGENFLVRESVRNNPHPSVMFMNWKVPTRLYNKDPTHNATKPKAHKTGYSEFTDHEKVAKMAEKIPPAYLTRKTHGATTTTHFTPKQGMLRQLREHELDEEIMREMYSREKRGKPNTSPGVTRFPAMPLLSAKLNAKPKSDRPIDAGVMPIPNRALTMSGRIRQDITQGDKNYINSAFNKPTEGETVKVVNNWLETASPRDRELAVEFFSSLAGKKLMGGQNEVNQPRAKGSGVCKVCDATHLKEVLNALKTGKPIHQREARNLRPGESNRRRLRLLSPFTRQHKEEMQTWHHLPTFRHTGPVSNTIALFTRPHRPAQRHFTIHPEWE